MEKRLAQVKQQKEACRIKQLPTPPKIQKRAPPRSWFQQRPAEKKGYCLKIEEEINGVVFQRKVFIPLHTKKTRRERILDVLKRGFKSSGSAVTHKLQTA